MRETSRLAPVLLVVGLGWATAAPAEEAWRVSRATVTLALPASQLEDRGLAVAGSPGDGVRSFEAALDLAVVVRGGRLSAPDGGALSIPVRGGLALRAQDRGRALRPAFLYDFRVEIDPASGRDPVRLVGTDPDLREPFEIRNGGVQVDPERGVLAVRRADVLVSRAWAERLGRPRLAGEWVGELEIVLEAEPRRGPARPADPAPAARGVVLDVLLGELYGIGSTGHVGEYPDGRVGLSAATTSCNNGTVPVPWDAPMAETHPFIGLALYREMDGRLEMLGQNWIKHGFAALQNDQCDLGCTSGSPFTELGVGCSDTYGVAANAAPYYLGPRSEVNPHTGAWEACGSWFDAIPQDCERDYLGDAPDSAARRIEVLDADLALPGASYYYEAIYVVADDDSVHNNIGWRECTMFWEGRFWDFSTVGAQLEAAPGPVVAMWADDLDSVRVAPDDGLAFLGAKVIPDGPVWHYEYALYNRTSARGIRSFAVPVGTVTPSNVAFRDVDQDAGNDWTVTVDGGWVTWSTDDFATDPDAPALRYQTLFNFRFDADVPPVAATTQAELFEPGVGGTFFLSAPSPAAGATAAPELVATGLALSVAPNPFSRAGRVAFSAPRTGPARLAVLDVAGRTVRVLLDGEVPAGRHDVEWNGRDAGGGRLAAGVYFFRLEQAGHSRTEKGVLLR